MRRLTESVKLEVVVTKSLDTNEISKQIVFCGKIGLLRQFMSPHWFLNILSAQLGASETDTLGTCYRYRLLYLHRDKMVQLACVFV